MPIFSEPHLAVAGILVAVALLIVVHLASRLPRSFQLLTCVHRPDSLITGLELFLHQRQ